MKALVVHPRWAVAGGGEYVCLNVIQALQEKGYDVTLMSEDFDTDFVRKSFGWQNELNLQKIIPVIKFKSLIPRFLALQRTVFYKSQRKETALEYKKYDLIFHTQTAYFIGPPMHRTFNIFYDPSDIFLIERYHRDRVPNLSPFDRRYKIPYYWLCRKIAQNESDIREAMNIPLAHSLENHLEKYGYNHSPYIFPPCDLSFMPKEKKDRIVQVTRLVPHKRLEEFIEIARRMPQREFLLVLSLSETEKNLHPGYAQQLLASLPSNVNYAIERIRNHPEYLEESAVYLYTSHEPGVNISTAQAAGAGCIPVTPIFGGGSEIVNEMMAGYRYHTIDQAVEYINEALDHPRWSSQGIRERSEVFSAERFRMKIRGLVE